MNGKTAIVLVSGLCAPAQTQPAAPPPHHPRPPTWVMEQSTDRYVTILRAICDSYLALSDDDRAAASIFYIGYQARRYGSRAINGGTIPSIEGLALDYCGINPSRRGASAFAEA